MSYLLDVSTLLALLWEPHVHNERVTAWQASTHFAVSKHGLRLATLDEDIKHKAAFLIPGSERPAG